MKAATFHAYGPPDVLHLENVEQPVPRHDEVLIRVHATPVNFADLLVRNFRAVCPREFHMPLLFWVIGRLSFGVSRPRIAVLGSEFPGWSNRWARAFAALLEETRSSGTAVRAWARMPSTFAFGRTASLPASPLA